MQVKALLLLSIALITGNILYGVCAQERFYQQQVKYWQDKVNETTQLLHYVSSQRGEPGERTMESRTRYELTLSQAGYGSDLERETRSLREAQDKLNKCRQNLIQ